jgi:hypothetical protein
MTWRRTRFPGRVVSRTQKARRHRGTPVQTNEAGRHAAAACASGVDPPVQAPRPPHQGRRRKAAPGRRRRGPGSQAHGAVRHVRCSTRENRAVVETESRSSGPVLPRETGARQLDSSIHQLLINSHARNSTTQRNRHYPTESAQREVSTRATACCGRRSGRAPAASARPLGPRCARRSRPAPARTRRRTPPAPPSGPPPGASAQ